MKKTELNANLINAPSTNKNGGLHSAAPNSQFKERRLLSTVSYLFFAKNSLIYFLVIIFMGCLLVSCSSPQPQRDNYEQISDKEYLKLLYHARTVLIDYPDSKISRSEKLFIRTSEPKFSANYYDDKTAFYDFSWTINDKTINYIGNGDMTNPKKSFTRVIFISLSVQNTK